MCHMLRVITCGNTRVNTDNFFSGAIIVFYFNKEQELLNLTKCYKVMNYLNITGFFGVLLLISTVSVSQVPSDADSSLLVNLMLREPDKFGVVLRDPDFFRLQVLYTRVEKKDGNIKFTYYTFRHRPREYFYPASIVKLPVSLLCLEKINRLKSEGVTKDTRLETDSSHSCQVLEKFDFTAPDSFPSIGNYIKKAMVVSDNEAYNRLYEFMGQSYINSRLFSLGYRDARVVHRFSNCDSTENKYSNGFVFYNTGGKIIWYQPPVFNTAVITVPFAGMQAGEKNMIGTEIINNPKDFSRKNCMPLAYAHDMLMRIFYPEKFTAWERFDISGNDLGFLKAQLCATPSGSGIAAYADRKKFRDAMTNYLYYGYDPGAVINPDLKIYNTVGLSYGFVIDCAYFLDTANEVEFFLSAVIYTNADGIIGDEKYEYATVAMPFMKELGKMVYEYERNLKQTGK